MSFFDDGEETAQQQAVRVPGGRPGAGSRGPRRPQPRRPQRMRRPGGPADQRTLMMRRGVAALVAVVVVVAIVLIISAILKSEKQQALKNYDHDVSQLAAESNEQVAQPLFRALAGAPGKPALDVEDVINQLRLKAQELDSHAQSLSVPSEMEGAQRDLLLTFDFRVEGMNKLAGLLPAALGGKAKGATAQIAGAMEIFLASDVVYAERVAPLIQQTLSANGISAATTSSRFLPNVGWLEANTVSSRITGQSSSSATTPTAGHHGSVLTGVSVANNALAAEPTLNHLSGGGSPTFTVAIEDDGEFTEPNVKVIVAVTAGGKQYKGSSTIEKTEPGKISNAEVKLTGVTTGVAAKVEAEVEAVPGETSREGTKKSYLAIFE